MNADDMYEAGDVKAGQVPADTQVVELVKYFRENRYSPNISLPSAEIAVTTAYKTIDLSRYAGTVGTDLDAIVYLMLWPLASMSVSVQYYDGDSTERQTVSATPYNADAVSPYVVSWRICADNFQNCVAPRIKGSSTQPVIWAALIFDTYTGKD